MAAMQYYTCKLNGNIFSIFPLTEQGLIDARYALASKYEEDLGRLEGENNGPNVIITGVNVNENSKGIKMTYILTTTGSGGIEINSSNDTLVNYYNIDIFTSETI